MLKLIRAFSTIMLLVFTLASCNAGQDTEQTGSTPVLSDQASEAIQNLAGRLDVSPGNIELIREEAVIWRNGGMGCPKKGMMYTQALVEGTLIVLRVNDVDYQYHSAHGRTPFYCENPRRPAEGMRTE